MEGSGLNKGARRPLSYPFLGIFHCRRVVARVRQREGGGQLRLKMNAIGLKNTKDGLENRTHSIESIEKLKAVAMPGATCFDPLLSRIIFLRIGENQSSN